MWLADLSCIYSPVKIGNHSKGRRQNSPQKDDKNMLGNISNLFVKSRRQVTKGHLYHLLGVSDNYVMYRQRAQSVLWNVGKDHRLGNWSPWMVLLHFEKRLWLEGGNDVSPKFVRMEKKNHQNHQTNQAIHITFEKMAKKIFWKIRKPGAPWFLVGFF